MTAADDWKKQANCRGTTVNMFPTDPVGAAKAKQVCVGCPVRSQCLNYATTNQEHEGIWGGLTEFERQGHTPSRTGRQPMPCGTRASYTRGCRCDACIQASRIYQRERGWGHRKISTPRPQPVDIRQQRTPFSAQDSGASDPQEDHRTMTVPTYFPLEEAN